MLILGIETSCDETAAAVVEDGRLVRSSVISSQIALHQAHGGIVPELAARGQATAIMPVVQAALAEAEVALTDVDAIAFTQGPGLAGSLLVGVNVAKTLGYATGTPTIGVNHLEGHVYANWLQPSTPDGWSPPEFPAVCLLVSGGHTELLLLTEHGTFTQLGRTVDDAAGEAFDKGARLLGLGYPGGPAIQKAAAEGDPHAFDLPRSMMGDSYDFSFSGLKTALLRLVTPYREPVQPPKPAPGALFPKHVPPTFTEDLPFADLAASFEQAVVDVLARKTAAAAQQHNVRSVLIAGGVAANARLRSAVQDALATTVADNVVPDLRWPELALCTDNAAMIAGLGYQLARRGQFAGLEADAYPRFPVGSVAS